MQGKVYTEPIPSPSLHPQVTIAAAHVGHGGAHQREQGGYPEDQQRRAAEEVYNTYFDIESKTQIDYELFDTLAFYGAMTEEEATDLEKRFEKIGENLFAEMERFDKSCLVK